MYGIPGEDEYWEKVRERLEAQNPYYDPEPEEGNIFVDEELDELEEKYGCSMSDLGESDLKEIVESMTGISPETVKWDGKFLCISYTYKEAS